MHPSSADRRAERARLHASSSVAGYQAGAAVAATRPLISSGSVNLPSSRVPRRALRSTEARRNSVTRACGHPEKLLQYQSAVAAPRWVGSIPAPLRCRETLLTRPFGGAWATRRQLRLIECVTGRLPGVALRGVELRMSSAAGSAARVSASRSRRCGHRGRPAAITHDARQRESGRRPRSGTGRRAESPRFTPRAPIEAAGT